MTINRMDYSKLIDYKSQFHIILIWRFNYTMQENEEPLPNVCFEWPLIWCVTRNQLLNESVCIFYSWSYSDLSEHFSSKSVLKMRLLDMIFWKSPYRGRGVSPLPNPPPARSLRSLAAGAPPISKSWIRHWDNTSLMQLDQCYSPIIFIARPDAVRSRASHGVWSGCNIT